MRFSSSVSMRSKRRVWLSSHSFQSLVSDWRTERSVSLKIWLLINSKDEKENIGGL